MSESLGAAIQAANQALVSDGEGQDLESFFAPDHVTHVTDRDLAGGPGPVGRYKAMLHEAFSDLAVEVEIFLEGDDLVSWQRTLTGTHTGSFMGFPATGRKVVWRDMATSRFRDQLIVEEWVVSDLAERLLRARKALRQLRA